MLQWRQGFAARQRRRDQARLVGEWRGHLRLVKLREILRLAFLAPDIQKAIIEGRQPANLSLKWLLELDVPADWRAQRRMLGLAGRG